MTTPAAKRHFRIALAVFLGLIPASVIVALLALPPSQIKEGLTGALLALGVMAVGFVALCRLERAMDREASRETREAHGPVNQIVN